MQYTRGLFALSADPITYGHLETIRLALQQCTELIVLVANNDEKLGSYICTLEERFAMTQRAIEEYGLKNVRVVSSQGLLTDVYMREGCDVIFRGIRHESDAIAEQELGALYAHIYPATANRFICIQPPKEYRHVSSSWVKHFVRLGVDVSPYVPVFVKEVLERRMNRQFKVAVTGELAVGKSWCAEKLVTAIRALKQQAHLVSLDGLLHELYEEDSRGAQLVRNALSERFGPTVLSTNTHTVNREALAQILFSEETTRTDIEWAQALVYPHVERLFREHTRDLHGIILVEWAQFVEMDMLHWVNNNVILVSSPQQRVFARKRELDANYQQGVKRLQLSTVEKRKQLLAKIERDGHGQLIECVNAMTPSVLTNIDEIAQQLVYQMYTE